MGMHWVKEKMPEAIIRIQTMNKAKNKFHTPDDDLALSLLSVAAMDDTPIFATSVEMLAKVTQMFERFQEMYGARTDWTKNTNVTIIGCPPNDPPKTIIVHSQEGPKLVPVVEDHSFLRADINNSQLRLAACLAIVENTALPALQTRKLPWSCLKQFLEGLVISKVRAKLNLQPISCADANSVDAAINRRKRAYYKFSFTLTNHQLTRP